MRCKPRLPGIGPYGEILCHLDPCRQGDRVIASATPNDSDVSIVTRRKAQALFSSTGRDAFDQNDRVGHDDSPAAVAPLEDDSPATAVLDRIFAVSVVWLPLHPHQRLADFDDQIGITLL